LDDNGLETLGEGNAAALERLGALQGSGDVAAAPQTEEAEQNPNIVVKAVMMSGNTRLAVVDVGEDKGIMARKGEYLMDYPWRVVDVRKNKVTVRINGKNIDYEVADFPSMLKNRRSKSNNTNNKKIGMEKFLFEGTVPKDSPLAPTVKQ
ncbi:MAG: hypothetical protein IJU31_02030, partial [Synergistaceae bacterium]|nr:hypothetical protein [Synergistaceae bacterium]